MAKHLKEKGKVLSFDKAKRSRVEDSKTIHHEHDQEHGHDFHEEFSEETTDHTNRRRMTHDDVQEQDEPSVGKRSARNQERSGKSSRIIGISIVVVMVLIIIAGVIMTLDIFSVRSIYVHGNESFSYYDISELSGIEYEQSIFTVDFDQVTRNIISNPMIEVEDIRRVLPSTIEITIHEREPVCFATVSGQFVLIGEGGVCLGILSTPPNERYPVVEGMEITNYELGQLIESDETAKLEACQIITDAMASADCIDPIEVIDLNNIANIKMEGMSDIDIEIGTTEKAESKMKLLKRMMEELKQEGRSNVKLIITNVDTAHVIDKP